MQFLRVFVVVQLDTVRFEHGVKFREKASLMGTEPFRVVFLRRRVNRAKAGVALPVAALDSIRSGIVPIGQVVPNRLFVDA